MAFIVATNKTSTLCGKGDARHSCSLCHHNFHANPVQLPESYPKMIAIPTGKRSWDGTPLCTYVENNCFHAWHAQGREAAWGGAKKGVLHKSSLIRFNGASQIDSGSDLASAVGDGTAVTPNVDGTPVRDGISQ